MSRAKLRWMPLATMLLVSAQQSPNGVSTGAWYQSTESGRANGFDHHVRLPMKGKNGDQVLSRSFSASHQFEGANEDGSRSSMPPQFAYGFVVTTPDHKIVSYQHVEKSIDLNEGFEGELETYVFTGKVHNEVLLEECRFDCNGESELNKNETKVEKPLYYVFDLGDVIREGGIAEGKKGCCLVLKGDGVIDCDWNITHENPDGTFTLTMRTKPLKAAEPMREDSIVLSREGLLWSPMTMKRLTPEELEKLRYEDPIAHLTEPPPPQKVKLLIWKKDGDQALFNLDGMKFVGVDLLKKELAGLPEGSIVVAFDTGELPAPFYDELNELCQKCKVSIHLINIR